MKLFRTSRNRSTGLLIVIGVLCLSAFVAAFPDAAAAQAEVGTYQRTQVTNPWYWSSYDTWITADVTGDGLAELVTLRNYYGQFQVRTALAQGDGRYRMLKAQNTKVTWYSYSKWLAGNIDGVDGNEIIGVVKKTIGGVDSTLIVTLIRNAGGTYDVHTYAIQNVFAKPWKSGATWLTGDANGDGKTDVIGVIWRGNLSGSYITGIITLVSNGDGTYAESRLYDVTDANDDALIWNSYSKWFAGEAGGDGRVDVIGVVGAGTDAEQTTTAIIAMPANEDGSYSSRVVSHTSVAWAPARIWFAGDVDGDAGKTLDLVAIVETAASTVRMRTLLCHGDGVYGDKTTAGAAVDTDTYTAYSYYNAFRAGDMDGDGRMDIVFATNTYSRTSIYWANSYGYFAQWYATYIYTSFANGDGSGTFTNRRNNLGFFGYAAPDQIVYDTGRTTLSQYNWIVSSNTDGGTLPKADLLLIENRTFDGLNYIATFSYQQSEPTLAH